MNADTNYHQPVMLAECMQALNIRPDGVYIDATYGGGGHSRAILQQLNANGKLIAFDQDSDAQQNLPQPTDPRLIFVPENFCNLKTYLRLHRIKTVDGILADLGVSSHQFDVPERGFSFRFDADLDMRMDTNQDQTAQNIINEYSETALKHIFRHYGELDNAHKIAHQITVARLNAPIRTTHDLRTATQKCWGKEKEHKFLAKLFQALRIEVNNEMGVLKSFLEQTTDALHQNGKLVVMSYHSLEDRLVKNYMRSGNFEGVAEKDFFGNIIKPMHHDSSKATEPTADELLINPRSRSAKLRSATKL